MPRPIVAADLETQYDADHRFPFFEDEGATFVTGYGHQDPVTFAAAVNAYDRLAKGGEHTAGDGYAAVDVMHRHGKVTSWDATDEPDRITYRVDRVDPADPDAFPVTQVRR